MIRVGMDMGIFTLLGNSKIPITAQEIAKATQADVVLLDRVLLYLAAVDAVNGNGTDGYSISKIGKVFASEEGAAGLRL